MTVTRPGDGDGRTALGCAPLASCAAELPDVAGGAGASFLTTDHPRRGKPNYIELYRS